MVYVREHDNVVVSFNNDVPVKPDNEDNTNSGSTWSWFPSWGFGNGPASPVKPDGDDHNGVSPHGPALPTGTWDDHDHDHNGVVDILDQNRDGVLDSLDQNRNGVLDSLDKDRNGVLDVLDRDHNGVLDSLDRDHNGVLDSLDKNGNGVLDSLEDKAPPQQRTKWVEREGEGEDEDLPPTSLPPAAAL
jgi:hypothetical protein